MKGKIGSFICSLSLICATSSAFATDSINNYTDLSFDKLGDMVTSVSKKEESAFKSAAAIYVLNQEDIKESGATSIPEALRMVPGLSVAKSDSENWAITSRGFNDGFGNKLLVLIDGRSVYTPLFSGVYWDVQDTLIEDIERIEVIRGPGAALWGANAVNGVINIITKKASETQSTLVNTGFGKEEKYFGEARYGGKIDDDTYYRVYAKRFNRDSSRLATGGDGGNQWYSERTGFRVDKDNKDDNTLTVQGDVYNGKENYSLLSLPETVLAPGASSNSKDELKSQGGNILARFTHKHDNDSESKLQAYYDKTLFDYSVLRQAIDTLDLDYQYSIDAFNRHSFVTGAGYRITYDDMSNSPLLSYDPTSANHQLFNTFVQDTVTLVPERLKFIVGSKFEHNDYTGFETQPNARLVYTPNEKNTIWTSVSRAVRTPSISEDRISLAVAESPDPGFVYRLSGNSELKSEQLLSYELGYRVKPRSDLTFDLSTFYNYYRNLRTNQALLTDTSATYPDAAAVFQSQNEEYGKTYGAEIASEWNITDYWNINASYTWLKVHVYSLPGTSDLAFLSKSSEDTTPENQFSIRSAIYLPNNWELSSNLYRVGGLDLITGDIPSYYRLDSRIAWKPKQGVELSLVGFNLLDPSHPEFGPSLHSAANEIERGYYFKLSLGF